MRTTLIGKHKVEIYDAIDELPIVRFHKYNKMMLIDGGIGADLADVNGHISKAMMYCNAKKPELALIELNNLRQNFYMVQSEISPKNLAFAALVKSIDGKECDDISDDGLKNIIEQLADAPQKDVTASIEAVKKKIDEELRLYFPQLFDDASIKEFYDQLRRRTLIMIDSIINGSTPQNEAEIDRITMELMQYNAPRIFSGSENMEITHDKNFARMCLIISQHLHADAKNFSVLEFYNAFEVIKQQMKEREKAQKRK